MAADGLAPPAAVIDASNSYFEEQETVGQWLDECTYDAGSMAFSRTKDLFSNWKLWCDDSGLKSGSMQAFSETLVARGYRKKRESGTGRQGLIGVGQGCVKASEGQSYYGRIQKRLYVDNRGSLHRSSYRGGFRWQKPPH